ncbi:hypothetical protein TNCV_3391191 [Trichonephila clavipes]|nr:hypothetical protein TNCV_3391191 [Trichonephila clavipes]
MDPACEVGTVQGHGDLILVWGDFLWHCLGPLVRVPTFLKSILYVELLGDHLHPLMLFYYRTVSDRGLPCHELKPSTTKDSPSHYTCAYWVDPNTLKKLEVAHALEKSAHPCFKASGTQSGYGG